MTTTQPRDIKIKLVSSIRPLEGDEERYEMWLHGSAIKRAGSLYLKYDEVQEEHTIHTTVKCTEDQALILRSGAVKMKLPLRLGETLDGQYENIYGQIPLQTETTFLQVENENMNGRFQVHYDLIINGDSVGQYKLEIQFQEV